MLWDGNRRRSTWQSGLPKTIDRFIKNGATDFCKNGNMEAALKAAK